MKPLFFLTLFSWNSFAADALPDFNASAKTVRANLSMMVEADTSNPPGNEGKVVSKLASQLKKQGFIVEVSEFSPGRKNLVARLKASKSRLKPILLLAHLDVVGTEYQNWTTPPHKLTEKEGFLYGRGVLDDLGMAAINLEVLSLLKKQKIKLERDLILALTGDEESGGSGLSFLLKNSPQKLDAALVLNEGGGPALNKNDKVAWIDLPVGEKTYQDFILKTEGPSGHSALPNKENAILKLSSALGKVAEMSQPEKLSPLTRAYFEARIKIENGEMKNALQALLDAKAELPRDALKIVSTRRGYSARLSSTCIPTIVAGGLRANVLPSEAKATVNCRLLPDETPDLVQRRLIDAIHDPEVSVVIDKSMGSGPDSPLVGEGLDAIRKVSKELWGAPVVPTLQLGMTDARYFRAMGIPAYGLNPIARAEIENTREHGADERIPVASLQTGIEFYYRLLLELAQEKPQSAADSAGNHSPNRAFRKLEVADSLLKQSPPTPSARGH